MRIGLALEGHRNEILKLFYNNSEQSVYDDYSKELLDSYIQDNGKYILIGDKFVKFIGYIFFSKDEDDMSLSIDEVIFDKCFLNKGYEEDFLYYILKYAECWGINTIKVNANIPNKDIIIALDNSGFNYIIDDDYVLKLKNEKN